jgi:hypothetical protein
MHGLGHDKARPLNRRFVNLDGRLRRRVPFERWLIKPSSRPVQPAFSSLTGPTAPPKARKIPALAPASATFSTPRARELVASNVTVTDRLRPGSRLRVRRGSQGSQNLNKGVRHPRQPRIDLPPAHAGARCHATFLINGMSAGEISDLPAIRRAPA